MPNRGLGVAVAVATALLIAVTGPARAGCSPNLALQDRFPAWSPDGSAIAFSRQEVGCLPPPETLVVVDVARGREREPAGGIDGLSWSPDGRRIAVGTQFRIAVVDVATNERVDVGEGDRPAWSPDGRLIAFVRRGDVWVVRAEGGEPRPLGLGTRSVDELAWAPDSTRLAVVDDTGRSSARSRLLVVCVDATDPRVQILAGPERVDSPSWSPDGEALAFESVRSGNWEIYSVPAEGGAATNLTRHPAFDALPAWSPDGEKIAFVSNRDRGSEPAELDVFVTTPAGDSAWKLASDPHPSSRLAWSPDSLRLAFGAGRECLRWGLYIATLDGRDERISNRCTYRGTPGPDVLEASPYLDYLYGLEGADELDGNDGNDFLFGGPGPDRLDGGRNRDLLHGGPGRDRLLGGGGRDTILARDGVRDTISCGTNGPTNRPELDLVYADLVDRVARDCERVARR
jgi:TolB protein